MSTLLEMIRARRAELERQTVEADLAFSMAVTDDQRVAAIEQFIRAVEAGSPAALLRLEEIERKLPDFMAKVA